MPLRPALSRFSSNPTPREVWSPKKSHAVGQRFRFDKRLMLMDNVFPAKMTGGPPSAFCGSSCMSAFRNVVVEPPPVPPPSPERIPEPEKSGTPAQRSRQWLAILVAILAVCAVLSILILRTSSHSTSSQPVASLLGDESSGVRLKGTTQAIQARAVLVPMLSGQQVGTLTITKLRTSGTHVKLGDV